MTTTTRTQQLHLPGQAAVADGPIDLTVMYVMHFGFRDDLDRFVDAARHTPVDDRAAWGRLERRWQVFADVLHNHHHGEDTHLWPRLRERADADELAVLAAMEDEHSRIDPLLASCADGFTHLAGHADENVRTALVVRLTATRDALGRHLAHEETDALPLLQRVLSVEEWHEIDERGFKKDLTLRQVLRIVPWAGHRLDPETQAVALRQAGAAFRLVWRLTRRRWARDERQAFAHNATPVQA
ncbi:hemerythrin domain-containing protein [Jatrophihabitans fulvus]